MGLGCHVVSCIIHNIDRVIRTCKTWKNWGCGFLAPPYNYSYFIYYTTYNYTPYTHNYTLIISNYSFDFSLYSHTPMITLYPLSCTLLSHILYPHNHVYILSCNHIDSNKNFPPHPPLKKKKRAKCQSMSGFQPFQYNSYSIFTLYNMR